MLHMLHKHDIVCGDELNTYMSERTIISLSCRKNQKLNIFPPQSQIKQHCPGMRGIMCPGAPLLNLQLKARGQCDEYEIWQSVVIISESFELLQAVGEQPTA